MNAPPFFNQSINAVLSGTTVTQLRDDIYLIDIVARRPGELGPVPEYCDEWRP